jgi:putative Mg2+ transporter-C (MgtC) family protein
VTGIGFVGAGVIFKGDTGINGVTTAATIWVVAALGMGVGGGFEWISIAGCILLIPILYAFTFFEKWLEKVNQSHEYKIVCPYRDDIIADFENRFRSVGLKPGPGIFRRHGNEFSASWKVHGPEKGHQKFLHEILNDPEIRSVEF